MTSIPRVQTDTPAVAAASAAAPSRAAGVVARPIVHAMTVDVEDYFQVQAFANHIDRGDWDSLPCRVEANTDRLLRMFDDAGVHITFFTLGWVAQRYPALIRRIVDAGHELGSHGMAHVLADSQTPEQFRADVREAKRLLEDIGGTEVRGYRAATFSINTSNPWAFEVLGEEGYRYSSSIYPVKHDFYGVPDAPRFPYTPSANVDLVEIPMTTVRLNERNFPCSGGGYFRLFPYALSKRLLRRVNEGDGQPAVFYMHPWEVDPEQPRQTGISAKTRFRHYVGLNRMQNRLARLLRDFAWGRMDQAFAAALTKDG